jgi:hypothetical protein
MNAKERMLLPDSDRAIAEQQDDDELADDDQDVDAVAIAIAQPAAALSPRPVSPTSR